MEQDIMNFLKKEERLNVELAHGHYNNFFDSEEEWLTYELQKFQDIMNRYEDLYSLELFGETIKGHKNVNPYIQQEVKTLYNKHTIEDREILSKARTIKGFGNIEDIDE